MPHATERLSPCTSTTEEEEKEERWEEERIGCHRLGSRTGKSIYQYNESIPSKLLLSLETKKTL